MRSTRNQARRIASRNAREARDAPSISRQGDLRKVWIFAIGRSDSENEAMREYNSVGSRAQYICSAVMRTGGVGETVPGDELVDEPEEAVHLDVF
jgi:hypothetical protein